MTILEDIKNFLGVADNTYDHELLTLINAAISSASQLGCIDVDGLEVDALTEWPVFSQPTLKELTRSYVNVKVKKNFDPTASASIANVRNQFELEMETRLQLAYSDLARTV